ncbi:hypothetical protein LCGC14_2330910, partial [marine sediment metagenome]
LKTLFYVLLDLSFNNIQILNFPTSKVYWNEYFEILKRFVDFKINFHSDPDFENDILKKVIFSIKRTRKNHYIPQGYLKAFICSPLGERKILVYDKERKSLIVQKGRKIENVAYSTHFYSIRLEQTFAKFIEPQFFRVIEDVIAKKSCVSLSEQEKIIILKFIFSLYLRTPDSRRHFKELTEKQLKQIYLEILRSKGISLNHEDLSVEITDLKLRLSLEHFIHNWVNPVDPKILSVYHQYLKNEWVLIESSGTPFITSDQPVILYSHTQNEPELNVELNGYFRTSSNFRRGLLEKGIQLYFPLTPKLCLLIMSKENLSNKLIDEKIFEQIVIHSYKYLYLSYDYTDSISEIIDNNLESLNRDGKRITIKKL